MYKDGFNETIFTLVQLQNVSNLHQFNLLQSLPPHPLWPSFQILD